MNEQTPEHFGQQYLSEVHLQISLEEDPYRRGLLAATALGEGAAIESDVLTEAFGSISEEDGDDPYVHYPLYQKIHLGGLLAEKLADVGRFDEAYDMAWCIWLLDTFRGMSAFEKLLERGNAGPDNVLLSLYSAQDVRQMADTAANELEVLFPVAQYLAALAAYGVDFSQEHTPSHKLLMATQQIAPSPHLKEMCLREIGVAYAKSGKNLELAKVFKNKILQHTHKAEVLVEIAKNTNGTPQLKGILNELEHVATQTGRCDGGCGYRYCNPPRDMKELKLRMAALYARIGELDRANRILNQWDDNFHFPKERLETHLVLYEKTGSEHARSSALEVLGQITTALDPAYVNRLGQADITYGRTMPSLEADDEAVPLVVWEIQTVYSHPEPEEDEQADDVFERDDYQKRRNAHERQRRKEHMSASLATLAMLQAQIGATVSARQTIERIGEVQDRVRAKVAFARLVRGL